MLRRPRQLSFDELRYHTGRGGPRKGAGRPPVGRRGIVHHVRRGPIPRSFPVHVTVRVRDDVPGLRTPRFLKDFRRSLRQACDQGDFRVVHYSVQQDHLHLLVEARDKVALGVGMKSVSTRIARAVNRVFGRKGAVLLGRYHVRVLQTPREVRHALRYVLLNVRKHAAGRVPLSGGLDPASSGRWFDGWRRVPRGAGGSAGEPEVAPARYWVTRYGWRRHRLIDPAEVPGRASGS